MTIADKIMFCHLIILQVGRMSLSMPACLNTDNLLFLIQNCVLFTRILGIFQLISIVILNIRSY